MIQIKKTILTLVALLAVTTGAWAQGPVDGTIAWSVGNEASATVSASIKDAISSTGVTTGSGLTVESATYFDTGMVKYTPTTANAGNVSGVMIEYRIEAVDGYKFKPTGVDYAAVKVGTDNLSYSWSYTIDGAESAITDVSKDDVLRNTGNNSGTAQLMHSESITADGCSVFTLRFYISNCGTTKNICIGNITISGSVSAAAPSGPEVAWDKTTKTGTFTMPGGNVIVEPEYFAVAEFTDGGAPTGIADIKATTDDDIVKAGTVKNIGSSTTPQGTVMYYAVQSATAPTAPDYDATGWTDKVPTATDFAEGNVYVWYYIKGAEPASGTDRTDANTCSDSEITALGTTGSVTLAAPPTYAITLKEGTEESDKWDISPAEATKGTTITATYSGERKVKSVKAVKKVNPNAYLKWDANQNKLVETDIPAEVTTVENASTDVNWQGTYVVEGDVTISGTKLTGDVDLIIKDGATLTANKIDGNSKNLNIYGQANQTGELVVNSLTDAIKNIKTLEVHSAKVTATASENSCGGFYLIEKFNVYGGLLDAKYTGSDGYGIYLSGGGKMNIYGGEVKAASNGTGANSYGIMASTYDSAITVTVSGGKLWAESPGNTVFNAAKTTFAKGDGFTGKIETSSDGSSWTEYTSTGTPDAKYVRVGY